MKVRIATPCLLPLALVVGASGHPAETNLPAPGSGAGTDPKGDGVVLELTVAEAALLHRLSLSPAELIAAGLTPQEGKVVIDDAKNAAAATVDDLIAAENDVASAQAQVHQLAARVRAGVATEEQVQQLAAAKDQLMSARSTRNAVLDQVWTVAVASVGDAPRTLLSTIRTNAIWALPAPYLSTNRSQKEWVQLRDVLANHTVCATEGTSPSAGCVAQLALVQANTTVATALIQTATHLPTLVAAWESALAGS